MTFAAAALATVAVAYFLGPGLVRAVSHDSGQWLLRYVPWLPKAQLPDLPKIPKRPTQADALLRAVQRMNHENPWPKEKSRERDQGPR